MIESSKLDKATVEEIEKLALTLNECLPAIEVTKNYLDLLSSRFNKNTTYDDLATLHVFLFHDNAVGNIGELLMNLKNKIDDVSYALYGADQ